MIVAVADWTGTKLAESRWRVPGRASFSTCSHVLTLQDHHPEVCQQHLPAPGPGREGGVKEGVGKRGALDDMAVFHVANRVCGGHLSVLLSSLSASKSLYYFVFGELL